MKLIPFSLLCLILSESVFSQSTSKPAIDSTAIQHWVNLSNDLRISADAKYFMFIIENFSTGHNSLVVESTENSWKREFIGAQKGFFSSDSKIAVLQSNDTLLFLPLGKDKVTYISGVSSYILPRDADNELLVYKPQRSTDVVLLHLSTGKEQRYKNVSDYELDAKGRVLILTHTTQSGSTNSESVEWINLGENKRYPIWQSSDNKLKTAMRFSIDDEGKQTVFVVHDKTTAPKSNQIWYFEEGMDSAIEKVSNKTEGIDAAMMVSNTLPYFSKSGNYIFFRIEVIPERLPKNNPNAVQLDVWNYKDPVLQSAQYLANYERSYPLMSAISVKGNSVFAFENHGQRGKTGILSINSLGDQLIELDEKEYSGDKIWIKGTLDFYLISLGDKSKIFLGNGMYDGLEFSPDSKYLIYYDRGQGNYFSYNIATRVKTNISRQIHESLTISDKHGARFERTDIPVGVGGWLGNENLLIYDEYDIWKVDITGKRMPANLTNGYGKKHEITFRIIRDDNIHNSFELSIDEPLFLTAFNSRNKTNGFFAVQPQKMQDPKELTMASGLYYVGQFQTNVGLDGLMRPIKAKKANSWIVKYETATNAPNFYLTKDFKSFKQLTNIQPQKNYNWFTTQLLDWKQLNGEECQGILYKPENFDPTKKYPVIVNYYENHSDQLNQFDQIGFTYPAFTNGNINLSWFVSRDYLIFVPDIHYVLRRTGESVVNSVVSGVKYLCRFSFIDSTRIGIQGHSFGGFETNYLVTHTDIFAAACEGAGTSDLISQYGSIINESGGNAGHELDHFEKPSGQLRLISSPWESMDAYIMNSPIFYIQKTLTPLLIMHNKKDPLVPWSQAVELFIGLRRLNKPVWMLQYDNGTHSLNTKKDQIDYTTRMAEFFDHYLKGAPAPTWMSRGIPARLKQIETGYAYDPSGNCGKDCKVCKYWNEKMKKDSAACWREIDRRKEEEHWQ